MLAPVVDRFIGDVIVGAVTRDARRARRLGRRRVAPVLRADLELLWLAVDRMEPVGKWLEWRKETASETGPSAQGLDRHASDVHGEIVDVMRDQLAVHRLWRLLAAAEPTPVRLRETLDESRLLLHYQPIVDLFSGHLVGVEALVRWEDPAGRLVTAGELIPIAEDAGVMEGVGDWVVEELARQTRTWSDAGVPVLVSFNLSGQELKRPELVRRVLAQLQRAAVDPTSIVVEISESAAMEDPERTRRVLADLRDGGVRFALDDFGTGRSPLARLRELPADVLKIDGSFVQRLPDDPAAASTVRAIIALARSLRMTPLAEGVETKEQWRFLAEEGCLLGQGYFFSPPVPAAEVIPLADANLLALAS
jgi:EAL domain-containing protein (putative c-di-GMP-specific phosphodiesterase class I)